MKFALQRKSPPTNLRKKTFIQAGAK